MFLGALGGIAGERILFPYLAGKPLFSNIRFIQDAGRGTTIINRKEEVVVRENERLSEVAVKTIPLVVGVRSSGGEAVYQGVGFVLTNDGLIATSNDLLPSSARVEVVRNDIQFDAVVKKRDSASGIAILKIDASNLPVVTFRENEIKLGEMVFLVGAELKKNEFVPYLKPAFVSKKAGDIFETTIDGLAFGASGSPLFDLDGNVTGLILVRKGEVTVVSIKNVRELLTLVFND